MNISDVTCEQVDKKIASSTKTKAFLYIEEITISLGVIGIFVPIIVDISINKRLTWSLIVGSSIIYFYSGLLALFMCKKNKCMMSISTYSVLLIPYLYLLETAIDHFYLDPSQNRFMEYALPISAIWLAIIWAVILFGRVTKINIFYRSSILFLLAIVGTAATNAIAYKITWAETFHDFSQMIEVLEYIGGAIFFFVLGTFRKINKKASQRYLQQ